MDLCVSCKGCKRDCPTGVDMARMKIEFLNQWRQKRGLALKDRIIATLPRWAPWAGRLPFLFNLRDSLPGAAWLSERLLGFSSRRTLPKWPRDDFPRQAPPADADTADLVLCADTFTNSYEAGNARPAPNVL